MIHNESQGNELVKNDRLKERTPDWLPDQRLSRTCNGSSVKSSGLRFEAHDFDNDVAKDPLTRSLRNIVPSPLCTYPKLQKSLASGNFSQKKSHYPTKIW